MRRPYLVRVVPSAKIPPSRRKINDTVLQRMTRPPEAAQDRPGGRGAQSRNYPAEVDRASLA